MPSAASSILRDKSGRVDMAKVLSEIEDWSSSYINETSSFNSTQLLPQPEVGVDLAVAAAKAFDEKLHNRSVQPRLDSPPYHGRGVMISEKGKIVGWSRDKIGLWQGIELGDCAPGSWTHVAFVQNGNTIMGYLNGAKVSMLDMNGNQGGQYLGYMTLGKLTNSPGELGFGGAIDQFRVWSQPRDQFAIGCSISTVTNPMWVGLQIYFNSFHEDAQNVTNLASDNFYLKLASPPSYTELPQYKSFAPPKDAMHRSCTENENDMSKRMKTPGAEVKPNELRLFGEGCPKECSGHGSCDYETSTCYCFNGFIGDDCGKPHYSGYAARISGGSHVLVPPLGAYKSVTFEMWISADTVEDGKKQTIVSVETSTGNDATPVLELIGNSISFGVVGNQPNNVVFDYQLNKTTWYFVAVTYTTKKGDTKGTGSATLYVDGFMRETKKFDRTAIGVTMYGSMRLGSDAQGSTPFSGSLDEFRIFRRACTPKEELLHVGDRLKGTEAGLIVYYRFDEGHGTLAVDLARSEIAHTAMRNSAPHGGPSKLGSQNETSVAQELKSKAESEGVDKAFKSSMDDLAAGHGMHLDALMKGASYGPSGAPFVPCPEGCSDNGRCWLGICDCLPSWNGTDCSVSLCPNACSGNGDCVSFNGNDNVDISNTGVDVLGLVRNISETIGNSSKNPLESSMKALVGQDNAPTVSANVASKLAGMSTGMLQSVLTNAITSVLSKGNQYVCLCDEGFLAPDCVKVRCPEDCNMHGTCMEGGKCNCTLEWKGDTCNEKRCPKDCSGHGNCVNGTCLCYAGWAGEECEEEEECPNACSGHGTCEMGGICRCRGDYTGADCAWGPNCFNFCSGRGHCINNKCFCESLFQGPDCSEPRCPKDCSDHGDCVNGVCFCETGWTGEDCSQEALWPLRCSMTRKGLTSSSQCMRGWRLAVPPGSKVLEIKYDIKQKKKPKVKAAIIKEINRNDENANAWDAVMRQFSEASHKAALSRLE